MQFCAWRSILSKRRISLKIAGPLVVQVDPAGCFFPCTCGSLPCVHSCCHNVSKIISKIIQVYYSVPDERIKAVFPNNAGLSFLRARKTLPGPRSAPPPSGPKAVVVMAHVTAEGPEGRVLWTNSAQGLALPLQGDRAVGPNAWQPMCQGVGISFDNQVTIYDYLWIYAMKWPGLHQECDESCWLRLSEVAANFFGDRMRQGSHRNCGLPFQGWNTQRLSAYLHFFSRCGRSLKNVCQGTVFKTGHAILDDVICHPNPYFPMNCNKVPWISLDQTSTLPMLQTSRAACRCLLHCSAVHPRDQSTFRAKSRWWHCCLVQACKYKRHLKMPSMFFTRSQANERIRQGTQCIEHFVAIFCVNSSGGNIPHNVALHQRSVGTMDGDANLGRP